MPINPQGVVGLTQWPAHRMLLSSKYKTHYSFINTAMPWRYKNKILKFCFLGLSINLIKFKIQHFIELNTIDSTYIILNFILNK